MKFKSTNPKSAMRIVGSLSIIVLPLMLAVSFALHFNAFPDFFVFKLVKTSYSAEQLLHTLTSTDGGFRLYTLPHLAGYLAVPLFIPASLVLAFVLFKKAPWHSLVGAALVCIGTVFLGGVFSAWLSFSAVGNMPTEQAGNMLSALVALTTMQGALMISSMLSALSFLGMIVLGFGLYQSRIIPRWSAALFTLGNILILAFIDLDNWMLIGALFMFTGMIPLSIKLLHSELDPMLGWSTK